MLVLTPPADWTPDRVRALRARTGMDQGRFAQAVGLSHNARVSEIETGRQPVSPQVAVALTYIEAHGPLALPGETESANGA